MSLNAQIAISLVAHETDAGDLSRQMRVTPASYALMLTDGTGAGQAQVVWSDSRTVGTTAENLDLRALPDTRDGASVTVSFTAVKAIYVRNTHATNSLLIGGVAGVGAFAGLPVGVAMTIVPGGAYCVVSPSADLYPVSPSIATNARFAGSGGSCTYDIVLIGEGTVT